MELLQKNAREEVAENARLMMSVAVAVRSYTNQQIKPLLKTQMIYSFCRNRCRRSLRRRYSTSCVRSIPTTATRKPCSTRPTRATGRFEWEADIVNRFRNGQATRSSTACALRQPGPRVFARPLTIHRSGLPAMPQYCRGPRQTHGRCLWTGERLWLEVQRTVGGAGRLGA